MKKITITFNFLETEVEYCEEPELSPEIMIESVMILGVAFCLDDLSETGFDKIRGLVAEVLKND
jgi:hypothetical protein